MIYSIEHKLSVFISSSMSPERYLFIRQELKFLLSAAGLFDVFVYEDEGASDEDAIEFYMNELPKCDVAIFLIDNKDGVSDAVNREIQCAYENDLRRIFVFCDENKKKHTDIQDKLQGESGNKYAVVHCFRDLAEKAYISLIQDLIRIYRHKGTSSSENEIYSKLSNDMTKYLITKNVMSNSNDTDKQESCETERKNISDANSQHNLDSKTDIYHIDKNLIHADSSIYEYLMKRADLVDVISLRNHTEAFDSQEIMADLKESAVYFLSTVLGLRQYDAEKFGQLKNFIKQIQPEPLSDFLELRFAAIDCFYKENFRKSISFLKDALKEAVCNPCIPSWLILDVAIDIRNIAMVSAGNNIFNQLEKKSEEECQIGQKTIDDSSEAVTYPVIDRLQSDLNAEIISYYEKEQLNSPYVVSLSKNSSKLFNIVGDIFWIALLHGSHTHLLITRDRMVTVLTMLVNLYSNRQPVVERVRLHYVMGENKKKLEDILRTYHAEADIFTPEEATNIIESIKNVRPHQVSEIGIFGFMAQFGYYCDDNTFKNTYEELFQKALEWIDDKEADYDFQTYIIDFLKGTSNRKYDGVLCLEKSLEFFIRLLKHRGMGWLETVCENLTRQNLGDVSWDKLREFLDLISESINDNNINQIKDLEGLLLQIAYISEDTQNLIENIIKGKAPEFYKGTFMLNREIQNVEGSVCSEVLFKHIESIIESIDQVNRQAKNGVQGIGEGNIALLNRIIVNSGCIFNDDQIMKISNICLEILDVDSYPVRIKVYSCEILIGLTRSKNSKAILTEILKKLKKNQVDYVKVGNGILDKDQPFLISLEYELLLVAYGYTHRYEQISEMLFSVPHSRSYEIIQSLKYIRSLLAMDSGRNITEGFLDIIWNYILSISIDKERDVKIFAVRGLEQLCFYRRTRAKALRRLAIYMREPNVDVKLWVISQINEIREHDPYKPTSNSDLKRQSDELIKTIVSLADIDRHYLVRKYAAEARM